MRSSPQRGVADLHRSRLVAPDTSGTIQGVDDGNAHDPWRPPAPGDPIPSRPPYDARLERRWRNDVRTARVGWISVLAFLGTVAAFWLLSPAGHRPVLPILLWLVVPAVSLSRAALARRRLRQGWLAAAARSSSTDTQLRGATPTDTVGPARDNP
ncbi:hypothetical protein Franean1_2187 [Parafrankia sp. EAN1pec]|nr:hypothetical protein Franean1_2187 [Frankia sp. EAN1pec]